MEALDNLVLRIEHVGSTSVPDLVAKDIVDIDIVYDDFSTDLTEIVTALETLGYYHNGDQGIPLREAFKRRSHHHFHPVLDGIVHHLYACPSHSPELKRHLSFRDSLRASSTARDEYVRIKRKVAEETNQDKKDYAALKSIRARTFIDGLS